MQDLGRVRYITRNYSALKGLKLVPFGVFMLIMALRQVGWTALGKEGDCTYTLPLLLVMVILVYAIDRYYARTFGTVEQSQNFAGWYSGTAVIAMLVSAIVLEIALHPAISLVGLAIGALFIFDGIKTRRVYYTVSGGLIAVVSLLPAFLHIELPDHFFGSFGFLMNATMGIILIITGVLDHFFLVRSLKPVLGGE